MSTDENLITNNIVLYKDVKYFKYQTFGSSRRPCLIFQKYALWNNIPVMLEENTFVNKRDLSSIKSTSTCL